MTFQIYFLLMVWFVFVPNRVLCEDIKKTEIKIVNDSNRYFALNPNARYQSFSRIDHVKGNIIFTSGKRIDGDHLILTFMDQNQFARLTDIEISLWYPSESQEGLIISCVEFVTDLTTSDAGAYFVDGFGIGSTTAEMLVTANRTNYFGFQFYIYGY